MANMLDYIEWRGDIPFSAMPFNEVDGLILSHLAYLPYEGIDFHPTYTKIPYSIEKISLLMEDYSDNQFHLSNDSRFIALLGKSERYKGLRVTDYVKKFDESKVIQFCAITIHISDDEMYISYCGTDSTILGWKEDFYMSFSEDVPSELAGAKYAKKIMMKYSNKKTHIGGHSKGGIVAVYSAVKLPPELQDRVLDIRNYDGPGFTQHFIETNNFDAIIPKCETFIPRDSLFGQILTHPEGKQVVSSTNIGAQQHDVYSWEVKGAEIIELESNSVQAELNYKAAANFLENTSPESRRLVIDTVFEIMSETQKDTVSEIKYDPVSLVKPILKNVTKLSVEDFAVIKDTVSTFVKSYTYSAADSIVFSNINKVIEAFPKPVKIMLGIENEI